MLYCCDVGASGFKVKLSVRSINGSHKKLSLISENEVLSQKWLCILHLVKRYEKRCYVTKKAIRRLDLVRLFLFIIFIWQIFIVLRQPVAI